MSKDILSYDKIYEMTFNLRVKESLFFRQKIKELYCPDFECEIESFCVILPSKYKKNLLKVNYFYLVIGYSLQNLVVKHMLLKEILNIGQQMLKIYLAKLKGIK